MKSFIFILLLIFSNLIIAQESMKKFHRSPLKYSKNELPFSVGLGPATGFGDTGLNLGLILDIDVYHILVESRILVYGFPSFTGEQITEKAILLGYQFRVSKFIINSGYGFGSQEKRCDSRTDGDCSHITEERNNSSAIKFGFDFPFTPYSSVGISYVGSNSKKSNLYGILMGMKFGVFDRNNSKKIVVD